ncbi:hypothetical protein ACFS07_07840 [Undibacterium arcticum]
MPDNTPVSKRAALTTIGHTCHIPIKDIEKNQILAQQIALPTWVKNVAVKNPAVFCFAYICCNNLHFGLYTFLAAKSEQCLVSTLRINPLISQKNMKNNHFFFQAGRDAGGVGFEHSSFRRRRRNLVHEPCQRTYREGHAFSKPLGRTDHRRQDLAETQCHPDRLRPA